MISSEFEEDAKSVTHSIFLKMKDLRINNKDSFYFLEAMRSPVGKIKSKFRFQIVVRVKNQSGDMILQEIDEIIKNANKKNVSIFIETNPQNLS